MAVVRTEEEVLASLSADQLEAALVASGGRVASAWLDLQRAMVGGQGDPLTAIEALYSVSLTHRKLALAVNEDRSHRTPEGR